MKQRKISFCFWSLLLGSALMTACYAQTKNESANTNSTKDTGKSSCDTEKTEDDVVCDFSSFNTLKQKPTAILAIPKPAQPKKAKKVFGNVIVRLLVNREGLVERVCKLEGNEILAESAVKAAMQLRVVPRYARETLDARKRDFFEFDVIYNFKK